MNIGVIGLGFVGLNTAISLAHKKNNVICYEKNKNKCLKIRSSEIPFHEPHLSGFLKKYLNNNLQISESLPKLINFSRVIFLCVGTPSKKKWVSRLTLYK